MRLLPALFFFLAVQLTYSIITHADWAIERAALVSIVFYFWNWRLYFTYPAVPKGLADLWSLSVEEQFYMVWPLVVAVFIAPGDDATVIIAMISCIAAVALWRLVLAGNRASSCSTSARTCGPMRCSWARSRPICGRAGWFRRGDSSCRPCGSRSCTSPRASSPSRAPRVPVQRRLHRVRRRGRRHAARDRRRRLALDPVLDQQGLRAVGRVSYGLYLWHFFVFTIVAQKMGTYPPAARIATASGITITATLFSWFVVEQRFLRRKHRAPEVPAPLKP